MEKKNFIILLAGIIILYVFADFVNKPSTNKNTDIEEQYQMDDCYIYPYKFYIDSDKKLIQIELYEMNSVQIFAENPIDFSKYDSKISFIFLDEEMKEKEITRIFSAYENNSDSYVQHRKIILQTTYNSEKYLELKIIQDNQDKYEAIINVNDLEEINLIKKDQNYFKDMYDLKNKIKDAQESEKRDYQRKYDKYDDTKFIDLDLLANDNDSEMYSNEP